MVTKGHMVWFTKRTNVVMVRGLGYSDMYMVATLIMQQECNFEDSRVNYLKKICVSNVS